jgi:hypothetical protein
VTRTRADIIIDTMEDLVKDFLYYDRKEDEELPVGSIEAAVLNGEVTLDDLVQVFREDLEAGLR